MTCQEEECDMYYLRTESTDPYFNLALEQVIFESRQILEPVFWLWQNAPTVVVGRYQNTAAEVNLLYAKEHNINIVRRDTGGGAVYHDAGNVNFSFICPVQDPEKIDLKELLRPMLEALRSMGVPAELSGRNDITAEGRKFSGCAFSAKEGKVLAHGTLLFDSDIEVMQKVLNVSDEKLENKGVRSVKSRVMNLKSFLPDVENAAELKEILLEKMSCLSDLNELRVSDDLLIKASELSDIKYRNEENIYGRSPGWSVQKGRRYPFGRVDVKLDVKKGNIIGEIAFSGDFFGSNDIRALENSLKGRQLHFEAIKEAVSVINVGEYISGMTSDELVSLLLS